ncbi:hypothetical protein F5Y11DRAFT_205427 [Daldinia sp. FL1419]|nr:hypothetical protein F5Y11DRAFT_205427 [Daldinia sp. FL1419]
MYCVCIVYVLRRFLFSFSFFLFLLSFFLLLFFFHPTRGHCPRGDPLIVWDNMTHSGNIPLTLSRAQPGSTFFESFSNAFLLLALGIDPAASLGSA